MFHMQTAGGACPPSTPVCETVIARVLLEEVRAQHLPRATRHQVVVLTLSAQAVGVAGQELRNTDSGAAELRAIGATSGPKGVLLVAGDLQVGQIPQSPNIHESMNITCIKHHLSANPGNSVGRCPEKELSSWYSMRMFSHVGLDSSDTHDHVQSMTPSSMCFSWLTTTPVVSSNGFPWCLKKATPGFVPRFSTTV